MNNSIILRERKIFLILLVPFLLLFIIPLVSSEYYASVYNYSLNWNQQVPLSGVYYNLTNLTYQFDGQGFNFNSTYQTLTVENSGVYKIDWGISFSGGNANEYGIGLALNGDINVNRRCYAQRTTTSKNVGNLGTSCIVNLTAGDWLIFVYDDEASPAVDIKIQTLGLGIVQVNADSTAEEKNQYNYLYLFAILLGFLLFIIGRMKDDNLMSFMAGLLFLAFAITFTINGYPGLVYEQYINTTIILSIWALAIYVLLTTAMKMAQEGL